MRGCTKLSILIILLAIISLTGCNPAADNLTKFNTHFKNEYMQWSNPEYQIADTDPFLMSTHFADSKIGDRNKPKGEDLLWALQMASLERIKQNHKLSNEYFDKAEDMLNFFDHQNELVDTFAATTVNENVIPYLGEEYDGIMINTYKALNFMFTRQDDLARVEFNRALDRQRRAKEKFAQELKKLQNQINKQEQKDQVNKSLENPEINQIIESKYSGIYAFKAYPDFVNPFATYLAGVYFNLVGDHQKAVNLLKESYGMVSENNYIAEDLVATEKVLDGQLQLNNTVWIFFENGLAPIKEEFRVDLPLFIVTNKVQYVGIALPMLSPRQQAYPYLAVRTENDTYETQIVADMDRVIQTEFSKDFKTTLTRAIISTSAKAYAQYALQVNDSSEAQLASLLVGLYSYATTAADLRIWTTLPKDFQVARCPIPQNRLISIEPPGAPPFEIKIPSCNNALIYIRIPFRDARPVYDLITY